MKKIKVILSKNMCDILLDLPIRYLSILINSVESAEVFDEESTLLDPDSNFIIDLLEQVKNQELE